MKLRMQVGFGPGHIVLDGDPAPSPKKGHSPSIFGPHLLWPFVQMAGWIKMPLGTEIGLGPGDFMFDRDPDPPPKKGAQPSIFGPCQLWPNGWMDQDATWHGSRPQLRRHCVRWGPASPPPAKGHPQFSANVYCGAKWSPISATAELLFTYSMYMVLDLCHLNVK